MSSENHWGVRLRSARRSKKWSQEDLAEKAGVSQSTITKIESGNAARSRYAIQLANALEVDIEWLTSGIEKHVYPTHFGDDDPLTVRDEDGIGSLCEFVPPLPVAPDDPLTLNVRDQLPVMNYWHHDVIEAGGVAGAKLALTAALDDAMHPMIRRGEAVMVVLCGTSQLRDGGIYVVQWGGTPTIRRAVRRVGGRYTLVAENADQNRFQPEDVPTSGEGLKIHGRVVWRGGWL